MDSIDRKILAELQTDGRISLTDLADRIGLTLSPTQRRVRDLERTGAITGYRAVVDPEALGLSFEALIFVTMQRTDRDTMLTFEETAARLPNVLQLQRIFGNPDYLMRVRAADLAAYTRLQDDVLTSLPGVQRLESALVSKNVVLDRPYPTDRPRM